MAVSKSIIVVGVVAVLGAGGWYAWQNYGAKLLGSTPKVVQAPASLKPAAKADIASNGTKMGPSSGALPAAGKDKLIDDLLSASGYKHLASVLPEQIIAGAANAHTAKGQTPLNSFELETMLKETFTSKGFIDSAVAEIKKNYDEKRIKAALDMTSTPVSKRMTELEQAQPSKADMEAFAAQPPTVQRMDLIRKLDVASKATELVSQMAFATARAMASSAAANDPKKLAKIDAEIEQARGQMLETMRNNVLGGMALAYRKASDADLAEYVKLQESESGKWLNAILSNAVLEEMKAGATKVGEHIAAIGQPKPGPSMAKSAKPMAAEKSPMDSVAAEEKPLKTAVTEGGWRRGSRSGQDSRECLDLATNVEIIKCAEQFR